MNMSTNPSVIHPTAAGEESQALTVLRRIFAEGFATGEATVVDELCSPELVEHQFGLAGTGRDAIERVKQAIREVHAIIPDLSFVIEDTVETSDTLWARVRVRGTATGAFFGPPSGRPVDVTVVDIVRVVDGQIVEHWGVPDRFALLAQTGVLARLGASRGTAPAVSDR
jgi:predicted ester cyclase